MRIEFMLLSFVSGVLIATQSALSGQLSAILKNPIIATLTVYLSGAVFIGGYLFWQKDQSISILSLRAVPTYLWFLGGLISALALTIVYKTMPSLGISNTLVCVICGQLILSVIASHFGWFNLPQKEVNFHKIVGVLVIIVGVYLVNKE